MDWVQTGVTVLTVIVSSGIIQFFVNRKDKKKEDEKIDLRTEMKQHLTNVNNEWKVKYCDKNWEAIQQLNVVIQKLTENNTKITESIEMMADKQDTIALANVGMVHNTIIRFTDPIIRRNAVTYEELSTLDSLYQPYSKLGGNGECKRRYDDVNKLRKISEAEAHDRDREIEAKRFREMSKDASA
jgi:hypothetical protein